MAKRGLGDPVSAPRGPPRRSNPDGRVGLNSGASDATTGSVTPEQDGGAPRLRFGVYLYGFCPFVRSEVRKGGTEMYHQEGGRPGGSPARWVGERRRLAGVGRQQHSEG